MRRRRRNAIYAFAIALGITTWVGIRVSHKLSPGYLINLHSDLHQLELGIPRGPRARGGHSHRAPRARGHRAPARAEQHPRRRGRGDDAVDRGVRLSLAPAHRRSAVVAKRRDPERGQRVLLLGVVPVVRVVLREVHAPVRRRGIHRARRARAARRLTDVPVACRGRADDRLLHRPPEHLSRSAVGDAALPPDRVARHGDRRRRRGAFRDSRDRRALAQGTHTGRVRGDRRDPRARRRRGRTAVRSTDAGRRPGRRPRDLPGERSLRRGRDRAVSGSSRWR